MSDVLSKEAVNADHLALSPYSTGIILVHAIVLWEVPE